MLVPGDRYENVTLSGSFDRRHDSVAVHGGRKGTDRIDLHHDDMGTEPIGTIGHTATAVSVSDNNQGLPGKEDVRRSDDAVEGRLAGPIVVVEQVLGRRVVDGDDRHSECPVRGHRLETDHAGSGLLRGSDDFDVSPIGVENGCQIGPIVHCHSRLMIEDGMDVLVVGIRILAANSEHRDSLGNQSGRNIVLSRQRVRGTKKWLGATVTQGEHQVCGLGSDVETRSDHVTLERTFFTEPLTNGLEGGHTAPGPLDPPRTLRGEIGVGDVVVHSAFLG